MEAARRLHDNDQLFEGLVKGSITANRLDFAKAALAVRSGLPPEVVVRILGPASAKAVVALDWRAGQSMDCTVLMQTRLGHINPDIVLHGRGHHHPLTEGEMTTQIAVFAEA